MRLSSPRLSVQKQSSEPKGNRSPEHRKGRIEIFKAEESVFSPEPAKIVSAPVKEISLKEEVKEPVKPKLQEISAVSVVSSTRRSRQNRKSRWGDLASNASLISNSATKSDANITEFVAEEEKETAPLTTIQETAVEVKQFSSSSLLMRSQNFAKITCPYCQRHFG